MGGQPLALEIALPLMTGMQLFGDGKYREAIPE